MTFLVGESNPLDQKEGFFHVFYIESSFSRLSLALAGHIPGAFNVPWEETIDVDVARARLTSALGEVPPQRVIVHCGSGVTSCHTLLQMHRLGMEGAALYVGSWSEWCRQGREVHAGS